jgi:glycosyltransferase involved in cell wall biosynthesis
MKLVALFKYSINKESIERALYFLPYMSENFNVNIDSFCSKILPLSRGGGVLPDYEKINGIDVYRRGLQKHLGKLHKKIFFDEICSFFETKKYSVILCFNRGNFKCAIELKKKYKIPLILTQEQAGVSAGLGLIHNPPYKKVNYKWRNVLKKIDALITWHPTDIYRLDEISAGITPVYHIYMCGAYPGIQKFHNLKRDKYTACYVGSLSSNPSWKNVIELKTVIPLILEKTPIKKFIIAGKATDDTAQEVVKYLVENYDVEYRGLVSREESLMIRATSFFNYSPIIGNQIGSAPAECWGTKTPLLLTNSTYAEDGLECIKPKDMDDLPARIRDLYDPTVYTRIQEGGWKRYQKYHTAEYAGNQYYKIIKKVCQTYKDF